MITAKEALIEQLGALGVPKEVATPVADAVLELHRKEMAAKLKDIEHWHGADHLAKSTIRTYASVIKHALKAIQ